MIKLFFDLTAALGAVVIVCTCFVIVASGIISFIDWCRK